MKTEEKKTPSKTESGVIDSPIIDMATTQPDAKGKRFASFVRDYHVCKAFVELAFRTGKVELLRDVKVMLIDGTTLHLNEAVEIPADEEGSDND